MCTAWRASYGRHCYKKISFGPILSGRTVLSQLAFIWIVQVIRFISIHVKWVLIQSGLGCCNTSPTYHRHTASGVRSSCSGVCFVWNVVATISDIVTMIQNKFQHVVEWRPKFGLVIFHVFSSTIESPTYFTFNNEIIYYLRLFKFL